MTSGVRATESQEMRDRIDIEDCVVRYCRGIDRIDVDIARGAFHDDATFQHPGVFEGTAADFIAWFAGKEAGRSVQHMVSNFSVDITGDSARAESYVMAVSTLAGADSANVSIGRYVDRVERRAGSWRIAHRLVLVDFKLSAACFGQVDGLTTRLSRRDRADASYADPLPWFESNHAS